MSNAELIAEARSSQQLPVNNLSGTTNWQLAFHNLRDLHLRLADALERSEREVAELQQIATRLTAELNDADDAMAKALPIGSPDSPPLKDRIAYLGREVARLRKEQP